jgi:hypothetical protein
MDTKELKQRLQTKLGALQREKDSLEDVDVCDYDGHKVRVLHGQIMNICIALNVISMEVLEKYISQ